jgi:cell division septum initiation protein DivIVA
MKVSAAIFLFFNSITEFIYKLSKKSLVMFVAHILILDFSIASTQQNTYTPSKESSPELRLELEEIKRIDFASSFSGFTLDQDKLATWHETGNGEVKLWDILKDGVTKNLSIIKSPHPTYDRPTFGCSLVMDGDFIGIGSYYTWRNNPHDGRFYVYNLKNNQKVSEFNPSPRSAQYFGMHASRSGDVVCVTQGGATHSNWRVPSSVTFYVRNHFNLRQIKHFEHPGSGSHAGVVESKGDYFASYVYAPLDRTHKYFLYLWKVQRGNDGSVVDVKIVDSISTNDLNTNPIRGSMSFGENMLYIGNAKSNPSDAFVAMYKINKEDQLEYVGEIKPQLSSGEESFGHSVQVVDDYVFVGAPEAKTATPGRGKLFTFKVKPTGEYQQINEFSPDTLNQEETFGEKIEVSGFNMVVSAGSKVIYAYEVKKIEKPLSSVDMKEGLLAHFPFDGDAQDYSGNHLHGQVFGAKLTKDRFGVENKAYQFDGVDDYIKVNHHQSLNQLPLSVSLWLKSEGNQKESGIISKYYAAAWNGWQLMEFDGQLVPWYLRSYRPKNVIIGKYGESKSFETSFTQNIWNHVVCVFSKSGGEIYLNNKLADSKTWTGQPSAPTSQYPLYFGKYSGVSNGFFEGKIDDVRIYNRALTEVEIVSLYEADLSGRGVPAMPEPEEVPGGFVNYITLLGEVNGKVQKAEKELSDLMKVGEEKAENIRELELEFSNVNQELTRVEGELKSCEEEGDRTRAEIKEVEKTILSRELEIIGLEGQVDDVQARLDAAQCEYLKVEERLEFLKEEMSGYADKLKTAHTPGWHYVPVYGWLWTSPKHYPQVYSNTRNGWLYYEAGTSEPWLYYDYNLEQWEEWFVDPGFFSLNN